MKTHIELTCEGSIPFQQWTATVAHLDQGPIGRGSNPVAALNDLGFKLSQLPWKLKAQAIYGWEHAYE